MNFCVAILKLKMGGQCNIYRVLCFIIAISWKTLYAPGTSDLLNGTMRDSQCWGVHDPQWGFTQHVQKRFNIHCLHRTFLINTTILFCWCGGVYQGRAIRYIETFYFLRYFYFLYTVCYLIILAMQVTVLQATWSTLALIVPCSVTQDTLT